MVVTPQILSEVVTLHVLSEVVAKKKTALRIMINKACPFQALADIGSGPLTTKQERAALEFVLCYMGTVTASVPT